MKFSIVKLKYYLLFTLALEKTLDNEGQMTTFSELKSALYDEMPYLGICYKTYFFVSNNYLETADAPQFFNPYRNMDSWIWLKRTPSTEN